MKLLSFFVRNSFVLIFSFFFCSCNKSNVSSINIVLYNKPLSKIKSGIQGKWKLNYEKGGICSTCINDFSTKSYIWEFAEDNSVKRTFSDSVYTYAGIEWIRDLVYYTNGDSTYVIKFYDKKGYPYNYVMDRIHNDTLILFDAYSVDAVYYYLTKYN